MMHLKDDFKEGDSVLNIKPSWLNQVAAFINYLHGRGCIINKPSNPSESNAPFIEVAESSGGGAQLSNDAPLADAAIAAAGTGGTAARFDHQHPLNIDNTNKPKVDNDTGVVGTAANYAKSDHQHPLNAGSSAPDGPISGGSAGSSTVYARADHRHPPQYVPLPYLAIPANSGYTPYSDVVNGAWGTATEGARRDHKHNLNVSTDLPADIGTAAATGTKNFYARVDHVHKGGSGTMGDATPKVDKATGVVGKATAASREDHQHPLNVELSPSNKPQANGTAAHGTAATYARSDHVHPAIALPANPSAPLPVTDINNRGVLEAKTTTWTAGGSNHLKIWRHRWRYIDTDGSEDLQGIQHYEIYDKDTGGLLYVSAEITYSITKPIKGVNPWDS